MDAEHRRIIVQALTTTNKVKVKCTLVQALRLCTGRVEVLFYSFMTNGTRRG
jgi:hypothetical protein